MSENVVKLENNFNKDVLINKGFEKAFEELMGKLIQSKDLNKIKNININKIKSMNYLIAILQSFLRKF